MDVSNLENPKVSIYYTSLHMQHSNSGKSETSKQDYTVQKVIYAVLTDKIQEFAEKLAQMDKQDVDDWLSDSCTPEDENVTLCFEPKAFVKK